MRHILSVLGNRMRIINPYRFVLGGNDAYTKLLLHFNGADESTTFTDSSASAHEDTANGDAQLDTAQKKFGTASGLFDGTGDFVDFADHSDFEMGGGDFTIDFWFRPTNTSAGLRHLVGKYTFGVYSPWFIYQEGTSVKLYASSNGSGFDVAVARTIATGISADTWYHIAYVRNGTTYTTYKDGVQSDTFENASTLYDSAMPVRIGASSSTQQGYLGHIDELRISKGIARWTSNFTPPTSEYS